MCVHRTPDFVPDDETKGQTVSSVVPYPPIINSRRIRKIFRKMMKEGGFFLVLWIIASCCTQMVNSVPLPLQKSGVANNNGAGPVGQWELLKDSVNADTTNNKATTGFFRGFVKALSMIIVSELGDKTFFIAAVMAMKHSRLVIFSGAMTALAFMTIFSALFGYVTTFIPRVYTYYISTALFAIFGIKMLYDGAMMSDDEGAEELEEVHLTLRQKEEDENTPLSPSSSQDSFLQPINRNKMYLTVRRLLSTCFSKTYIQALTMTFLAEWGDRSQLATVVLAAQENILSVCVGGVLGHSFCTGLAVIGGRMIAQRISVKTVTIIGGFVFLGFAIVSLFLDPES